MKSKVKSNIDICNPSKAHLCSLLQCSNPNYALLPLFSIQRSSSLICSETASTIISGPSWTPTFRNISPVPWLTSRFCDNPDSKDNAACNNGRHLRRIAWLPLPCLSLLLPFLVMRTGNLVYYICRMGEKCICVLSFPCFLEK